MTKLVEKILVELEDNKALDIVSINVSEKTSLTDYLIFATGTSNRHIGSISEAINQKLKKLDKWILYFCHREIKMSLNDLKSMICT